MDREKIQRLLAQVEEHIERGTAHVERQRTLVERLERDGHNSEQAKRVLETFEDSLHAHMADHQRLLRELEFVFLLGPGTVSGPTNKR
jgi:hypothetical protein